MYRWWTCSYVYKLYTFIDIIFIDLYSFLHKIVRAADFTAEANYLRDQPRMYRVFLLIHIIVGINYSRSPTTETYYRMIPQLKRHSF
uniref:Putative product n=1 Tax=Xenopsylla cheopis TaxID=163159 RepID=A0A6M2E0D5_XENCH